MNSKCKCTQIKGTSVTRMTFLHFRYVSKTETSKYVPGTFPGCICNYKNLEMRFLLQNAFPRSKKQETQMKKPLFKKLSQVNLEKLGTNSNSKSRKKNWKSNSK